MRREPCLCGAEDCPRCFPAPKLPREPDEGHPEWQHVEPWDHKALMRLLEYEASLKKEPEGL